MTHADVPEQVVLLDASRNPIGTADKATVHTESTPLHLAFSSYILNDSGEVLITRRALSKRTWPGVWTNTACGHPAPDESFAQAISRRARQELGMDVADIREVLADFQYRAVDASGIVENEFCPVYLARAASAPKPASSEVAEHAWVAPEQLFLGIDATPFAFSPWMVEQLTDPALRQALLHAAHESRE